MTTFDSLNLSAPILKAVKAEGYETPTPIQAQSIPHLLAGRDPVPTLVFADGTAMTNPSLRQITDHLAATASTDD